MSLFNFGSSSCEEQADCCFLSSLDVIYISSFTVCFFKYMQVKATTVHLR